MKIWPENDPKRQSFLYRWCDSLFYPYMGEILDKGSKLHKERMNYQEVPNSKHNEDDNDHNQSPDVLKEISKEDIFQAPADMQANVLQERFRVLFEKKHKEMLEKQSKRSKARIDAKAARKARRWALLHVLWNISKPTYQYAAFYQLVTVLVQSLNPLAVQYMLRLLEKYPNENVFTKGIGFAIALFACSVVESIAQERHKFLSFQSGILIRAATVSSIYHHMLNLTSKGKQHLLTGETTNLVAIDCQKLFEVCQEGHLIWSCPLSMLIVTILLLTTLGPSTLVGMMSMFLLVPLVKKVVGRMMVIRRKRAIHTDKRVDTTTSMLQAIKFCKLNHYEEKFLKRVHDARKEEMVWVRKELAYIGLTMAMTVLTPVIACALTYITYILVDEGNTLSASDTFTTLLLFSVLRFPINYAGKLMGKAAQGIEACQRISDFFDRDSSSNEKVVEEGFEETNNEILPLLEVNDGSFTVGGCMDEVVIGGSDIATSDPESKSKASFTVSGVNFEVRQSEILAVVGPVGSGKSTLLHALIGDVASNPTDIKIRGSVAYASQTPFILNATVRDNILFGKEYDKDLYDKVVEACNLRPDLKQLGPAKDLTEIGERGVTLSGGQKARISIARCVYAQPSVALFDDVLSALDAATGKFIFDRLFDSSEGKKTLLSKSAVVLVTHAAHFLSRVDKILVLVKGQSVFTGTWSSLLTAKSEDCGVNEVLKSLCSSVQETGDAEETAVAQNRQILANIEDHKDAEHGTIMTEEERDFGLSNWKTWIKWYKYAGGVTFAFLTALALAVDRGFYVANEWWLASWTRAEFEPIRRFGRTFSAQIDGMSAQYEFIKYYVIILLISFVGAILRSQWIIQGGGRCSEKLFNEMTSRVIRAPMSYFETTPMGRILNRLTYDVEILDISLSQSMTVLMTASGWFVTGLILQITILPWNVFMLVPIIAIYWLLLLYYRKSAVDLQRLDAVSRSPVQADLAEGKEQPSISNEYFITQTS
jgi:ABC-type multidrug transport system, ATPase and permease components